jgi:CHAD domain-containing protein
MKDHRISDIIHHYFKKLGKHIAGLKKNAAVSRFNEKTLHLFRVDVKTLRALLRMLQGGEKTGSRVIPHKLKKGYSLAGKMRDRQLCIKRIKKHKPGKIQGAKRKLSSLQDELKSLTDKKNHFPGKKELSEMEITITRNIQGRSLALLAKTFFLQKSNAIREIISMQRFSDSELHNIRKNIKDIVYITGIFMDFKICMPGLSLEKKELKKMEGLAQTLGAFNDLSIALSMLQMSHIKKSAADERDYLLTIRKKWLREKRELKKKVVNELKTGSWDFPMNN